MAAVVRLDNGRFPLTRWRGGACLMADVCPYHVFSGHISGHIASHCHCLRGSVVSYGGRCPVGQRPVSTRVKILRPPWGCRWTLGMAQIPWGRAMTWPGKRYPEREMPIWSGKDGGLMGAGCGQLPLHLHESIPLEANHCWGDWPVRAVSSLSLAGLRYLLADPVDPLGPMEPCQLKSHGWQLSEMYDPWGPCHPLWIAALRRP